MATVPETIRQAELAISQGDIARARELLKQVLRHFPNDERANLLFADVAERSEYAIYSLEKVLELNPSNNIAKQKLLQLRNSPGVLASPPPLVTQSFQNSQAPDAPAKNDVQPSKFKKCPYCAEEILAEAIVCRFCNQDLNKESPQVIAQRRSQLTQELAELETELVRLEVYLQQQIQIALQAGRQVTFGWLAVIGGLFLIPVIIGLIFVPVGFLAVITHGARQGEAETNQNTARKLIEVTRMRIIATRAALAAL